MVYRAAILMLVSILFVSCGNGEGGGAGESGPAVGTSQKAPAEGPPPAPVVPPVEAGESSPEVPAPTAVKVPGDTPQATFEAMRTAVLDRDADAMIGLFSPDLQKKMEDAMSGQLKMLESMPDAAKEGMAAELGMTIEELADATWKDFFQAGLEKMDDTDLEEAKNSRFVKADIEGDKAKVTITDGDEEETADMILVDGKWYMAEMPGM